MKAETRGFSLRTRARPHRIARHADDAALLAEEIERLHGLFGQADDALGREHGATVYSRARRSIGLRRAAPSPPIADRRGRPRAAPPRSGDAPQLAGMVADIDHRHVGLVAQPHEIGQDFALARGDRARRAARRAAAGEAASAARGRSRRAGARRRRACRAGARAGGRCRAGRRCARCSAGIARAGRTCGGRNRDWPRPSGAETAGPPGTRSRCGGDAPARSMRAVESNSTVSSSAMRPRSGRDQAGDHVDDRGLAGARAAEQRGDAARRSRTATSMAKSPSRFSTSTASIVSPRGSACRRGARTIPTRSARRAR